MEREKDLKNYEVKKQYLIVPIAVAVILAVLCAFYSVVSADESVEVPPENMSAGRWGVEVPPENMPWSGYYWPFLVGAHNLYSNNGPMQNYDSYVLSNGLYESESSYTLESDHPYLNNYDATWTITWSGATKVRLHFTRFDIEGHYDHLKILDGSGNQILDYNNSYGEQDYSDVWTPWVDGDTIKVRLKTDYSVTYWGFKIGKIAGVFSGSSGAKNWEYKLLERSTYPFTGLSGHRTVPPDPSWEGHCDGWSAAAIREDEPTTTRILNGIEFDLNDQKGLLTATWKDYVVDKKEWFPINQSAAKLFHDTLTQYIKDKGKPIVMDIYTDEPGDEQVWNHPAYGYWKIWYGNPSGTVYYTTRVYFKTDGWSPGGTGTPDTYRTYKYYINYADGTSGFIYPSKWPDLMWYPTERKDPVQTANPCVTYDTVKEIVEE